MDLAPPGGGRLYRCDYWEHTSLAYDFLEAASDDALLEAGWAKLQKKEGEPYNVFLFWEGRRRGRLTKEQVETLVAAGFPPRPLLLLDAEGDWRELAARLYPDYPLA